MSCIGKRQFGLLLIALFEKVWCFWSQIEYPPEMDNNTVSQSCATVTIGIINFVDASENMTFIFPCLVHVPEWVLCWVQAIAGTVSQQEKQIMETKLLKNYSIYVFSFLFLRWLLVTRFATTNILIIKLFLFEVKETVIQYYSLFLNKNFFKSLSRFYWNWPV
jgi:hypothetical protein